MFLSEKLEWYDLIYQDIERNGYRQSDSIENNVEVALAANGDLLLIDGRHRLILAQLLGLKKIPVVVNLVAESVAKSLLDCSDQSIARPCKKKQKNHCSGMDISSSPSFGRGEISRPQKQHWPPRSSP